MTTWTLAFDESGRFEAKEVTGEGNERAVLVVGGVLFPKDAVSLDRALREPLKRAVRGLDLDYPPHAVGITPTKLEKLRGDAADLVAETQGRWIFVVEREPPRDLDASLAIYVRMLSELVDVAARLAARGGATNFDVRAAQRSVPFASALAARAQAVGLGVVEGVSKGQVIRPFSAGETRQALDALTREPAGDLPPWPKLNPVEVLSANFGGAHPGLVLADLGCHRLYTALRDDPSVSLDALLGPLEIAAGPRAVVLERASLKPLRTLDRALRERPALLHEAARVVARLEGDAARSEGVGDAARASAAGLGRELWDAAIGTLGQRERAPLESMALALGARASAHLAARGGDYEGTWRALWEGWAGDGPLAVRTRGRVRNREVAAQLWRATIECANHRGDVGAAERARIACEALFRQGMSLALLAERLRVLNLTVVTGQNRLPASAEETEALRDELAQATRALQSAADEAGEVLSLATASLGLEPVTRSDGEAERVLWREFGGGDPRWEQPDHERGRTYGTVARTWAFLGDLDQAFAMALKARSLFADADDDLTFNATVLARMEIERARLGAAGRPSGLEAAMSLARVEVIRTPRAVPDVVRERPAARFALDVLLRAMRWGVASAAVDRDAWLTALARDDDKSILLALSGGELRSHPTELVARHAGELLSLNGRTDAARRWFDLSLAISDAAPRGSAIARFGGFTRRLAEGVATPETGPLGGILHPTFEYR